jgi:hypothetical protein
MKKLTVLIIALTFGAVTFASDPGGIDEKLIQSFQSSFPKAEKVNWYELQNAYVVNFVENGIRGRITYRKDGASTQYTRYYTEELLPFVVQSNIKQNYPGKSIYGVIEVSTVSKSGNQSKVDYYVKMQDARHWTMVKADMDGNTRLVEKFKKQ